MAEKRSAVIPKNFVLAYILLVGLPLLGVFTILDAGRGLVPPPAVSGEWDLTVDAGAANTCFGPLTAVTRQILTISQSGTAVSINFDRPQRFTLAGTLEGNRLTGVASFKAPAGTCPEGAAMRWTVAVVGEPRQRAIEGQFFLDGCQSCAPVAFRASRRPLRKRGQ